MAKENSPAYSGDQDDIYRMGLFIGTAGGLLIGMPLYVAAEYLDEVSDLKNPMVHIVFPPEKE